MKVRIVLLILLLFSPTPGLAADKVVLQLRWDHQFQFAGYYAAKWRGYYADAGFDVEIRSAVRPDGTILKAVEEVAGGRADFGVGAADILIARDRGADMVVLASIFQQSAAAFFALEGTPLDSPRDLLDLRVARNVNDLIDIELQAMLRVEGIDPATIRPYPHEPSIANVVEGRVDVHPGYRISAPFFFRKQGVGFKMMSPSSYGIDFYGDALFTHRRVIERDSDAVERFVRAVNKGWIFALEHPAQIADRIAAELPNTRRVSDKIFREFNRFQIDAVKKLTHYPIVEVGHINPHRWRRMNQFLRGIGIVNTDLDTDAFIFDPSRWKRERERRRNALIESILLILVPSALFGIILAWTIALRKAVTRKTAALLENERRFRAMFENHHSVMLLIDPETGGIVRANKAAETYYGYPEEDFSNLTIYQINQGPKEKIADAMAKAKAEKYFCFYFSHRLASGDIRGVEVHSSPIPFGGKPILFSIIHDITERRRAEMKIHDQARLLDLIFAHSLDSIVLLDSEYNFIRVSETYAKICHRDLSEFPGHNHFEFYPSNLKDEFDEAVKEKKIYQRSARPFVFPDHPEWGTTYWDLGLVPVYGNEEKIELFLFTLKNVTDQKKAEKALQSALDEKVVLLREIHHRVKNNMQVIISLLRMHARKNQDPHLKMVLEECRGRIEAMSLIHETLYQSNEMARIDFRAYLLKLCRNLGQVHDAAGMEITVNADHANVALTMDQGIAVGMVIAELVSNAFKHAFTTGRGGNVTAGMAMRDAEIVELTVADDGKGLPADFDISASRSLGMRLVWGAVTRELGGSIEATNDGGAKFVLRFKGGEVPKRK